MSINRVVLTGRLTKDVELRVTANSVNVASFTVAVDGFTKDQNNNTMNQASFISCVAWNQSAKFLSTYCKKGSMVALEGRLQTRSYDRRDGTKAYVTEVIVDRVENLSPRDNTNSTVSNDNASFSINASNVGNEEEDNQPLSYSDDDLPF